MSSSIEAGQLWVSSEPTTYYIAKLHADIAFVVPVIIKGVGKSAQVIANGEVKRLPVMDILETWMPAAIPMQVPRTWHEQLLERLDE
jgi:hypothetical protein